MTPDQEARGAELYAAGRSEREVAAEIGCSASAAHRLKERLTAAQDEAPSTPQHAASPDDSDPLAAAFASASRAREQLAAQLQVYEERAESSRQARAELEAERLQLLDAGQDAAPLRPRIASAVMDLDDSETSAGLVRQRLAELDRQLADVTARQELARMRRELAAAVPDRDAVFARTGDRMRAAIAAVKAAAEEFTAALTGEQAAGERTSQLARAVAVSAQALGEAGPTVPLPVSTAIYGDPGAYGGAPLALYRAVNEARAGNAMRVAVHLAEMFGQLPPSPEELAAEAERMRQWRTPQPVPQRGQPWTRPDVTSVDVDEQGREVYRPAYRPHPLDSYRAPGIFGGPSYGAGYRTGY